MTTNTFCGMWCLPQVHNDRIVTITTVILHISYCACTKRPYFHFRSKIWRHHPFCRLRFLVRLEDFGDSRTFKAYIRLLIFAWIFRTSWPKMLVLGAKWRMEWCDVDSQWTRFHFRGSYICVNFRENGSRNWRNATVTVRTDGDTHTQWPTQTGFYRAAWNADAV